MLEVDRSGTITRMAHVPWPDVVDAYAKGITSVGGVLIAGGWGIYRYRRTDPYLPCVNSHVEASLHPHGDDDIIEFEVSIQHVGGGRLDIDQGGKNQHAKPELRIERLQDSNGTLIRDVVTGCTVHGASETMTNGESCRQSGLLSVGTRVPNTIAYDVVFTFTGRRPPKRFRPQDDWTFEDNTVVFV